MSAVQFAVRQDGMFVAKVDAVANTPEGEARARQEALHYLAVYGQDGPCELWRRNEHRRWRPLGIRISSPPASPVPSNHSEEL